MMRHSATQGEKMKKSGIFCRKHYRRIVEHIPVIVPITVKYELNGLKHSTKDYEYQLKCPVCWERERNKK